MSVYTYNQDLETSYNLDVVLDIVNHRNNTRLDDDAAMFSPVLFIGDHLLRLKVKQLVDELSFTVDLTQMSCGHTERGDS